MSCKELVDLYGIVDFENHRKRHYEIHSMV
jgi:hypothetical protein